MKVCSVEECKRTLLAKGLCSIHYYRQYHHGTINISSPGMRKAKQPRSCAVRGCERNRAARGLCPTHYKRFIRYGWEGVGEGKIRRYDQA